MRRIARVMPCIIFAIAAWSMTPTWPCRLPPHASHTLDLHNTGPSYAGAMIKESSVWGSPVQSGVSEERGTAVGLSWDRPRPMRR